MTSCICGGTRGYYDDPDEPREAYCTCAAAFRVRKRDEWQSVPERTVFVNSAVIRAILARRPLVGVDMDTLKSIKFKGGARDGWAILPDPDCPRDYAWPESAPPEVAAVVRQGIEDAREVTP